ncbi:MAG: hypothetical protein JEZ09_03720 [Salinivirgaceae bacterium]|nr:hypothetical protein [Salinivirgaceae bacterium]
MKKSISFQKNWNDLLYVDTIKLGLSEINSLKVLHKMLMESLVIFDSYMDFMITAQIESMVIDDGDVIVKSNRLNIILISDDLATSTDELSNLAQSLKEAVNYFNI